MSFLIKGINKLSQIDIDVNKDWAGLLIKNLGAAVDSNDAVIKAQALLQSVMTSKGDIIYRGNNEAASLRGNYGVGYNFLHMKSGGQMEPEWLDIQDLIIYLTGALNRQVRPPGLNILAPALLMSTMEDHSGGGFMDSPILALPLPVISNNTTETYSGGQETQPVLNVPVPSINVTAQLV